MLKVSWRTTSDMAKPQFSEPSAPNYTTVEASNGARLEYWIDRLNIRPWVNTLLIRVGRGFLRAGDTLTVRLGDTPPGLAGLAAADQLREERRAQGLVDAFATYEFSEIPQQPAFALVPGPAATLEGDPAFAGRRGRAVPPGHRGRGHVGQSDRDRPAARSRAVAADRGLPPASLQARGTARALSKTSVAERRRCRACASCRRTGEELARANPLRVVDGRTAAALLGRPAWPERRDRRQGSAENYFRYARDKAFVDIVGHQGNDFQITDAFWQELND